MTQIAELPERRTTTDLVFDSLHDDIVALNLLPGAKLSEAEIARRFGVSRQPVRDAFNRLANLDLLLIRPQRATEVRGFSMASITHARFVRLAVELEVIRRACAVWDDRCAETLRRNLDRQEKAVAAGVAETFHELDQQFHELICEHGGSPLAIQTIRECKQKVDRLCVLSLGRAREAATLLGDHRNLAAALAAGSVEEAVAITRLHLTRLDATIEEIQRTHSEYFE
ncbi:GntR family transcriptional regulator [Pikeienuella piscinae]|uniref:GntR family transcriptional regulator n=1 Tax=Pikeienuella piscinae TaxID=2748098 RepID=A0A7L5BVQ3_9RHOB|nr:GntR family transcriptional regulator [Pikeienuella piscinae]QIE55183.1 GntR family transcriptional regulator [Pikeienuella piscinae]